jgi:hypothetical protein
VGHNNWRVEKFMPNKKFSIFLHTCKFESVVLFLDNSAETLVEGCICGSCDNLKHIHSNLGQHNLEFVQTHVFRVHFLPPYARSPMSPIIQSPLIMQILVQPLLGPFYLLRQRKLLYNVKNVKFSSHTNQCFIFSFLFLLFL